MNAFFKRSGRQRILHPFYTIECLYELLWHIDEDAAKMPPRYRKLRPEILEMTEHSDRSAAVADYARICDMSKTNFRRLFLEYTGQKPVEYRNDLRLQEARMKLQSGEYNVSEAAQSSGFSNLSFFIRQYKK